MKKSKIFSVVLAMFLILTLNVGAVRAADTARIYLDAVQAKSGIVTVSCKAENVGKISNGKLRITYAADKLHLVKTEAGDGLKKGNFQTVINDPIDGNKAEGEIVFVFASSREQEVSGNLVTMTFSASEKLDLKDTGLNLKAEEWNKTSGSDINVSIKDLQYRSEVIDKIDPTPTPEKKISLNDTQIAEIEDQTYTGRAVRPGVTIQYQGKTLTEAKDYALTYKKNKKIGKASVTIKGIGEYEGSKTMTFYIAPRPPRIKKAVSDSRKKVSLRWSKKKQADGYQIKIARDKQFTRKVKTVNIKKNTKVKKTVKVKGKGRAKYYVRIRSYKIIDGKKHYGKFGYKKAVRVK